MLLSNMLSIANVQGETYENEYSAINNNLTMIFGEPIYKKTRGSQVIQSSKC